MIFSSISIFICITMTSLYTSQMTSALNIDIKPAGSVFTRNVGGSMLITCEAGRDLSQDERSRLTVGWYRDVTGREIVDTHGDYMYVEMDVENPSVRKLYITSFRAEDAGVYSCRVHSPDGQRKSSSVTIQLFRPITFEDASSPQNPVSGTSPVIRCLVSGSPQPSVSWRYKGKRVGPETSKRYQLVKEGLKIHNISASDSGEYMCRAEVESDGRYADRKIKVEVFVPPVMLPGSDTITSIEGGSATLQCKATGVPAPSYRWFHRQTDVSESNRIRNQNDLDVSMDELMRSERVLYDGSSGVLNISMLSKKDEGHYKCRAENAAGGADSIVKLKVQVKPKISHFSNVSAAEGASLLFDCKSEGDPAPELRLIVGLKALRAGYLEEGRGVSVVERSPGHLQMIIQRVQISDADDYICAASSSLGEDRRTAFLTVNYAPRFSTSNVEVTRIWPGQNTTLGCHSQGVPSPVHSWSKDGRTIENNFTYSSKNVSDNRSILFVRASQETGEWIYGRYTCRANNYLGEASKHFDLLEGKIPGPPSAVLDRVTAGRVNFNVTSPVQDGGVRVEGFVVEVGGEDDVRTKEFPVNQTQVGGVEIMHALYLDVLANKNYVLKIRAKNAVGLSEPAEIKFETPPPQGECVDPDRCEVTWSKPITGGLLIERYEISWRLGEPAEQAKSGWFSGTMTVPPDTSTVRFILTRLKPASVYEIKVIAFNSLGPSPAGVPVFIRTAPSPGLDSAPSGDVDMETVAIDSLSLFHRLGNSTVVISLIIAALILLSVLIDLICYCVADCGIIKCLCVNICGRKNPPGPADPEKTPAEGSSNTTGLLDGDGRLKDGHVSPQKDKLNKIDEEPLKKENRVENEATPDGRCGQEEEAELTDEQSRLLVDHEDDVIVDVRERPVPTNRKSILSTGDERWRNVVKELEKEMGVQKSEEGEEGEGRPVIKLMTDSMNRRPLSQDSSDIPSQGPTSPT